MLAALGPYALLAAHPDGLANFPQGEAVRVFDARRGGVLGFEKHVLVLLAREPAGDVALAARAADLMPLSHAGLSRVLDVGEGEFDGALRSFVVIESCRGKPLAEWIQTARSPLPTATALGVVAKLAELCDHAQRKRTPKGAPVVFGALSLGNLIVSEEGDLRLTGFQAALPASLLPDQDAQSLLALLSELTGSEEVAPIRASLQGTTVDFGTVCDAALELSYQLSPEPAGRSLGGWLSRERSSEFASDDAQAWISIAGSPIDVARCHAWLVEAGATHKSDTTLVVGSSAAAWPLERAIDLAVAASHVVLGVGLLVSRVDEQATILEGFAQTEHVWLSLQAARVAKLSYVVVPPSEPSPAEPHAPRHFRVKAPRSAGAGKFFGRAKLLAQLGAEFQAAISGAARICQLSGAPGIGKSRLLLELERRLVRVTPPVNTLRFACRAHEGGGFLGLLRLLGEPSMLASESERAFQLGRAFESLAQERPLVLLLDDVDGLSSAERGILLAALGLASRPLPLLIVTAQREEGDDDRVLDELDDTSIAQLVASRLGARMVPPELFEPLVREAGGHPLFLEETLRVLQQSASISVRAGVIEVSAGVPIAVPSSLSACIDFQLERLDPHAKRAALALAVLGRDASDREVATLSGADEGALDRLLRCGFCRADERDYLSLSSAYAEAILAVFPAEDVRRLHQRAAALLPGDDPVGMQQKGTHLVSAGQAAEGAALWLSASRAMASDVQAVELALRGLQLDCSAETAIGLLSILVDRAGDRLLPDAVTEAIERGLTAQDTQADPPRQAEIRARLARMCVGQPEVARVLIDQAEALDPAAPGLVDARLSLMRHLRDPREGRQLLSAVVRDGCASQASLLAAIDLLLGMGQLTDAAIGLERALPGGDKDVLTLRLRLQEGQDATELDGACDHVLASLRQSGSLALLAQCALWQAERLIEGGREAAAFARLSEALRAGRLGAERRSCELARSWLDALAARSADGAALLVAIEQRADHRELSGHHAEALEHRGIALFARIRLGEPVTMRKESLLLAARDMGHVELADGCERRLLRAEQLEVA